MVKIKYKVYKHTTPSGKSYIGMTGQKPNKRWKNGLGYQAHNYFNHAINKYGWENIEHEIVADKLTKDEAINLEIELIAKYDTTNPDKGYNMTTGGEHFEHSPETIKKMCEVVTDRHRNNPVGTLTYEDVKEIRKKYVTKNYTQDELGEEYNISRTMISRIVRNKVWVDEEFEAIKTNKDKDLERAKLIKKMWNTGKYTRVAIARKLGVHRKTVERIVNGKTYKEI